jgi:dTMP kinase
LSKPRFITIEGGEGGGKSTQVARLAGRLRTAGLQVVATREPGGAEGAEMIRKLLVEGEPGRWDAISELLLHFAARRDHVRRTVLPALERGQWVVSDRFVDSTMAYQGFGHQLGRAPIEQLSQLVLGTLKPDLTLILDIPVEKGLARTVTRGVDNRYERMTQDFHERLRQGFLDIAKRDPGRCVVIDATRGADEISAEIAGIVKQKLGAPI